MEIILLERVAKLGQMGEVVNVRDGHARNFLLPQGKALRATRDNVARFEAEKAEREARNLEARKEAEKLARELDGKRFNVIRAASEAGALYGSVSTRDAAEAATAAGFAVTRGQVRLSRPIKELGLHEVEIILHPEVEVTVTLNVARSEDEAQLQASGKTIQERAAEEEAAAEFEIAELFDDIGAAGLEDDDDVRGPASDSGLVETPEERGNR